jgi:aminoglycoside phosphotransferase family enzyme/predicted kinase
VVALLQRNAEKRGASAAAMTDEHDTMNLAVRVVDERTRVLRRAAVVMEELARPGSFPAPRPSRVERIETHASWVFLGDTDVFKVKKPVNFGFLDFTTIEKRRAACEAEVSLNARLASGIYLGLVPVARTKEGALVFGGSGEVVDWAVHMRRLPSEQRADLLLAGGKLTGADVDALADRIAAFHGAVRCDHETSAQGATSAIRRNVVENFSQAREVIEKYLSREQATEIERWQLAFLAENGALFDDRVAERRVRDGHGDLRLEHVYIGDRGKITIIDCIEFNERFRYADVCADVAFLSMDLAWHGRVDLAERLLARYAQASGDYDLYAMVDFYESYRAYVRGKVATLLAADELADQGARDRAVTEARRYFLLALAAHRRPLLGPSIVCVGGLIASGKSTIAEAIALEMSAPVVDADRTRKRMIGVAPEAPVHDPAWTGAYDLRFTEDVYAEVRRRAGVVLASGRPVVIDSSLRSAAERARMRELARSHRVPIRFVECRADPELCRVRLERRERESGVSDGRVAIFDDFCARFEPMSELSPSEHVVVQTSRPLSQTLLELRSRVQTWPRGLVA